MADPGAAPTAAYQRCGRPRAARHRLPELRATAATAAAASPRCCQPWPPRCYLPLLWPALSLAPLGAADPGTASQAPSHPSRPWPRLPKLRPTPPPPPG
ncbi:hypothetical protein E2562_017607, partial [Oryza meyeriana var. granulata]